MKEVINPAYLRYEDFVRRVPRIFEKEGRTIYKARNEIKVFEVDGVELNVKRYKVPALFNRIVYRFFRQPKAVRAYEYAQRLVDKGFETPAPVAYILFMENGLLSYSYFISFQSSYKTLYEIGQRPVGENEDIFRALGTYMAELHEAEIYHADFSPGNVLYCRSGQEVKFSLIDINRMYFGPVSLKRGCANFARLWGQEAAFPIMAKTYAETRRLDVDECLRWVLYYRNRFWEKYASRHEVEFEL